MGRPTSGMCTRKLLERRGGGGCRRTWGRGRGARVIRVPWGQLSGSHVPGALCNGPHTLQWTPHFAMDPTLCNGPHTFFRSSLELPPLLYTLLSPPPPSPHRQLGDSYGIPKVHFKGQQDDFFIMVRGSCSTPPRPALPCPCPASSPPAPPTSSSWCEAATLLHPALPCPITVPSRPAPPYPS